MLLPEWYRKVKVVGEDVVLLEGDAGKGVFDNGKVIIPCEYSDVKIYWQAGFVRGYAVQKNNRWAYFDRKGVRQTEFLYTGIKGYFPSSSSERKGIVDALIQFEKDGKWYLYFQGSNGKFTPFSIVGAESWSDINGLFIGENGDFKTVYAPDATKRKLKQVQKPVAGIYEFRKEHYYFIDPKDQMKTFTYAHKLVGSGPVNWNKISADEEVEESWDEFASIEDGPGYWEGKVTHEWLNSNGLNEFATGTQVKLGNTLNCLNPSNTQFRHKSTNVEVIQKGKKFYAQRSGTNLDPVPLKYKKAWLLAPGYSYIGVFTGKKYGIVDADGKVIVEPVYDEVRASMLFGSYPLITVVNKEWNAIGYFVSGKKDNELIEIGAWDLTSQVREKNNMCVVTYTDSTGRKQVQPMWPITLWYDCNLTWKLGSPCDSVQAHPQLPGVWMTYLSGQQGIEIPYLNFQRKQLAGKVNAALQFDMNPCSKEPLSHNVGVNVCTVEATGIRTDWYVPSKEQWKTASIPIPGYESAYWLETGTVLVATQPDGWSDLYDKEGKPLLNTPVKVPEGNQNMVSLTEDGNFLIVELKSGEWKALNVCNGWSYALPKWSEK